MKMCSIINGAIIKCKYCFSAISVNYDRWNHWTQTVVILIQMLLCVCVYGMVMLIFLSVIVVTTIKQFIVIMGLKRVIVSGWSFREVGW